MDIIFTSVIASFIFLLLFKRIAFPLGLVDRPGGRKQHHGDVPIIGGLAVFLGVVVTVVTHDLLGDIPPILLLGGAIVVATGALDDRFGLSVRSRICVHVLVVISTAIATDSPLFFIDGIGNDRFDIGIFAWPVTVIVAVGVFNAFNLMDGMDGLAGSMAVIATAAISGYDGLPQLEGARGLLVLFIAALLPFLFFNLGGGGAVNKIFLGDAGSVLIGYLVMCSLIESSQGAEPGMSTSDALWACALPIFDTLAVMMQRIAQGTSPFQPDRRHIHHLLLATGLSKISSLIFLITVALILMFIGHAAAKAGAGFSLVLFVVTFVAYTGARWWCWRHLSQISAWRALRLE